MKKNIAELLQSKKPEMNLTEIISGHLDRYSKKPDISDTQDIIETIRERLFKPETHDRVIESMEKSKYRPSELLIAIQAWVEIFGDNGLFHKASIKEKQAPVKFIKKHLEKKYGITDTRKLGRISTIVNYREK